MLPLLFGSIKTSLPFFNPVANAISLGILIAKLFPICTTLTFLTIPNKPSFFDICWILSTVFESKYTSPHFSQTLALNLPKGFFSSLYSTNFSIQLD